MNFKLTKAIWHISSLSRPVKFFGLACISLLVIIGLRIFSDTATRPNDAQVLSAQTNPSGNQKVDAAIIGDRIAIGGTSPTATPTPVVIIQELNPVVKSNYYSLPEEWNMVSCEKVFLGSGSDILNTSLPIHRCQNGKSTGNNTLDCNKDWTAAFAETAEVVDFPLLKLLSAISPQGTEDNNVQPLCYYDILNNSTREKGDYVLANYSNDYPGLLQLKGPSKIANISFPRLGTASSCGVVEGGNPTQPMKLDIQLFNQSLPQIPDKVSNEGKDSFFSWLFNLIKSVSIFKEALKSKEVTNVKTVKDVLASSGINKASVCDTNVGKPVTKINISDKITPTPELSEFVVNKKMEILNYTNTELCDMNFSIGSVINAECTFNSLGTFKGSKDAPVGGTGLVVSYQIYTGSTYITMCRQTLCGFDGSCGTPQSTLYQACRGVYSKVDSAGGNPQFILAVPGFDTLSIQGANMTLSNTVNVIEQINGPYDINYGENIGIKLDVKRKIYDLNSATKEYDVDMDEGPDYDPLKVSSPLREYISYTKTPYNYNYKKDFPFNKMVENTSQFYFPYLGKLPYLLERISIIHSNTLNPETSYTMTQGYLNVEGIQTKTDNTSDVLGSSSDVSGEVYVPQLKLCKDLTEAEKEVQDCYGTRTNDPVETYLCQYGLGTNCLQCLDEDTPGGGNCSSLGSVQGKVAWPVTPNTYISNSLSDHVGTDFGSPQGNPVYAVAEGEVVFVRNDITENCTDTGMCDTYNSSPQYSPKDEYNWWWGGYGNVIGIKHNDGVTVYAHLNVGTAKVQVGDCVTQGQQIAESDDTGGSSGPHLHFEIRKLNCVDYTQSCVTNINSASMLDASLNNSTGGSTGGSSGSGSTGYYCKQQIPIYSGGNLVCLFKIAADTLNTTEPRIAGEIIYAITKQETSLNCAKTWEDWLAGSRVECTGDADQLAFITRNGSAPAGIDVRGLTQFTSGTFNSITAKYQDDMQTCITALGVKSGSTDPEAVDPLSSNSAFSRHRVGDAICAAALKLSDDAKSWNSGNSVTPEQWLDLQGFGGQALYYAAGRYYGACIDNYCENVKNYAQEAIDSKTITGANCLP